MALTLVTDPKKTINGLLSDTASTVQLFYEFKREDHEYTSIADDGGDVQIILAVGIGDVSAEFAVGDTVYLKEDADGYTARNYTVTGVTFAANTKVTINLTFVATGTGYINLMSRIKHHIEANIYDEAGTTLLINFPLVFSGTQAGVIKFDIGKFIKGYLKANDIQDIIYQLKWREAYIGLSPPALTALDNIQAIDSILPLLHEGGSNMWDYVPNTATPAKYLTKFTNPVMWREWLRKLSWIVDENMATREAGNINVKTEFFEADQNRAVGASIGAPFQSINIVGITARNISLSTSETYQFVKFVTTVENDGDSILEDLFMQVLDECKNPICIEWLNSLGAYEQHVFEMDQDINDSVQEGFEWQRSPLDEIDTEINLTGRTEGELNQVITMADQDLTIDQIQALREIKSSTDVRIWLNKTGFTYVNVSVNSLFDTLFNTDSAIHEMQLSIKLPKNFNFFDSKLY